MSINLGGEQGMEQQELSYEDTKFKIDTYWLDPIKDFEQTVKKPLAIILPGGAFKFHSDREAQPIAMKFASVGIHSIVFHYQLTEEGKSVYPLALQELATLLNWVKNQADKHDVDLSKVMLVGFSAGCHVVADFNALMTSEESRKKVCPDEVQVQPCANILGYPVIDMTIGWPTEDRAMEISPDIYYWQAQEHLTKNSKPTFIWQTVTDQTVPVMNSIVYAQKMELLNIPYELHLFGSGGHGLSLANYITKGPEGSDDLINHADSKWWDLCVNWLKVREILPKD